MLSDEEEDETTREDRIRKEHERIMKEEADLMPSVKEEPKDEAESLTSVSPAVSGQERMPGEAVEKGDDAEMGESSGNPRGKVQRISCLSFQISDLFPPCVPSFHVSIVLDKVFLFT